MLRYLLTYLITYSMKQSPSWEANRFTTSQEIPPCYGTCRFITAFSSVRHLSLSWASLIQSISPHLTSWRYILILFSHLLLGPPSSPFPSGFHNKTLYTRLLFTIRATCSANFILLNLITRTLLGEQCRSLISSLCSFLHFPVTLSLLSHTILLSTLFSNILTLRPSFNVKGRVSRPYKSTRKIIVLCILVFKFLGHHEVF